MCGVLQKRRRVLTEEYTHAFAGCSLFYFLGINTAFGAVLHVFELKHTLFLKTNDKTKKNKKISCGSIITCILIFVRPGCCLVCSVLPHVLQPFGVHPGMAASLSSPMTDIVSRRRRLTPRLHDSPGNGAFKAPFGVAKGSRGSRPWGLDLAVGVPVRVCTPISRSIYP